MRWWAEELLTHQGQSFRKWQSSQLSKPCDDVFSYFLRTGLQINWMQMHSTDSRERVKKNKMKMVEKLSRAALKMPMVRTQQGTVGWEPRYGCGAATGRCRPGRSGSSPAACRLCRPPPPDGPPHRGSPPPAAEDWPPGERPHIYWINYMIMFMITFNKSKVKTFHSRFPLKNKREKSGSSQ